MIDARRVGRQERDQDDGAGAPRAQEELSFGADVPQPHAEGQRTRQADQDERRGLDQGVVERRPGSPKAALKMCCIGADRLAAGQLDDDAADDQRHDQRADRGGSTAASAARSGGARCAIRRAGASRSRLAKARRAAQISHWQSRPASPCLRVTCVDAACRPSSGRSLSSVASSAATSPMILPFVDHRRCGRRAT